MMLRIVVNGKSSRFWVTDVLNFNISDLFRDAWKEEEGISKTEAKRRYISFLIKVS